MTTQGAAEPAPGRPRGDTAARILAVAREIVGQHGVDALRLGDVAARLGLTPPALYAHFPRGRSELVDRIAQDGVRQMVTFFPQTAGTAREDLLGGVSEMVRFFAEDRAFLRISLLDFSTPDGHPSISREIGPARGNQANGAFLAMFARLDDLLAQCLAPGRALPVSAGVLLNVLIGSIALNLIYPPQPQAPAAEVTASVEAIVQDLVRRYLGLE